MSDSLPIKYYDRKPGECVCLCMGCELHFLGDKRDFICAECEVKATRKNIEELKAELAKEKQQISYLLSDKKEECNAIEELLDKAGIKEHDGYSHIHLSDRVQDVLGQLASAREAIAWYADEANWEENSQDGWPMPSWAEVDLGGRAREALKEKGE